jgi:mannose-1-phosphate guanylyltransferase/mannose-6-phosphate isomerase
MTNTVINVVLSGGSGKRLWPKSRKQYPKQLLKLNGEDSMLQQTIKRACNGSNPIVVCNEEQRFMIHRQLQEINCDGVMILEPFSRNTAPAIAVAAMQALKQAADPVLVVMPADHQITDEKALEKARDQAVEHAIQGKMVAFGIVPKTPDTGFGYIKVDGELTDTGAAVSQFAEKPDVATAKMFLESGDYFWNTGMFVFKARVYLEALAKHSPEMMHCCEEAFIGAIEEGGAIRLAEDSFNRCPDDSIDYAVMEHADNVWLVPLNSPWNDLGNWSALWEIADKDENGNVEWGDVLMEECSGSFFHSDGRLIAAIGLDDLVIVDTKDAVLVAPRNRVQEVKKLVSRLEKAGRTEHVSHREVVRPWGTYDPIDEGPRYQVKHIVVNPGESLSLQMHHHRAEHWIVVSGTALVQREDEEMLVSENESVYISIGEKHRLSNPGKLPLQLIEVQSGCYLGEDDIVRYSDIYDRVENEG